MRSLESPYQCFLMYLGLVEKLNINQKVMNNLIVALLFYLDKIRSTKKLPAN